MNLDTGRASAHTTMATPRPSSASSLLNDFAMPPTFALNFRSSCGSYPKSNLLDALFVLC
ncbi:hypothetical protein ACQ858_05175 [Variovorax ureilyticus]|uniref:hypothetical protein n=1 Tax=Variovorax ureilyticus TaxID=1836198 RepID=UPI003D66FC32